MKRGTLLSVILACGFPLFAQLPADLGAAEWYRPPQLSVMVGFIKDPQHKQYSVREWARDIGANFDAESLVARLKRAGVIQIIWYDKWIDGLVFRKTKTTTYTTERDFLAPLAAACRKHGVKLVTYFNTFYDGNPEFAPWAAVDQRGKPIPFSPFWPENLLSMYSPFRETALEQIRELVVDYGVDGIWLDVPGYAVISHDAWTREAFRKQYGKDMDLATMAERWRFANESAVQWNRQAAEFARRLNPKVTVTTNEAVDPVLEGPARAAGMAAVVDYFSTELHTQELQLSRTQYLRHTMKPFEAGTLLSDDWFTPLGSGPLKSSKSANDIHVECASVFSAGMNLYLAVTLAHDGSVDEHTLKLVDLAGEWLEERRPYLAGAEAFSDVAILLGTPDPQAASWPGGPGVSERATAAIAADYNDQLMKLEQHLIRSGYHPERLINLPPLRTYKSLPRSVRAVIVPDRAQLSAADRQMLEQFVRAGGSLIALGRGGTLRAVTFDEPGPAEALFGVTGAGYTANGDFTVILDQGKEVSLRGPLLHIKPTSATPILYARHRRVGEAPFLTVNRVASGRAYLVGAPEGALLERAEVLDRLWKTAIGEPATRLLANPERYTVRIRRQERRMIVHLIDSPGVTEGPMRRYRPLYTRLALNSQVLPKFEKATLVPSGRPLPLSSNGIWKVIELFPDPELTIVLE
jgi:alpha-L-fucosidase